MSPRFFGPFQILQKVGTMSNKLALPPKSKLHLVFHVFLLEDEAWSKCAFHTNSATSG